MNDFARSLTSALALIGSLDDELLSIVALSLRVSLAASFVALLIGAPFGAFLAIARFRGRQIMIVLTNALLGLRSRAWALSSAVAFGRTRVGGTAVHAQCHGYRADFARHADRGGAGAQAGKPAVGRIC